MSSTATYKDYYKTLGIPQSADLATIKSRYRSLALVKHPDRQRNNPNATAEFQLVSGVAISKVLFFRVESLIYH